MNDSFESWRDYYEKVPMREQPAETVVRAFKGDIIPGFRPAAGVAGYRDKSILDLGCGTGCHLPFLNSLGFSISAVEVSEEIVSIAQEFCADKALDVDFKVGHLNSIPFADQAFDYVLCWSVLHYLESYEDFKSALHEIKRVIKADTGWFFVSVTGTNSSIVKSSKRLDKNRYTVTDPNDFRCGQTLFLIDSEDDIVDLFGDVFTEVKIGRVVSDIFSRVNDEFLVAARA